MGVPEPGDPIASAPAAAHAIVLPSWAVVSETRRAHIARVVALIDGWAVALGLPAPARQAWVDAATWHDALRDAPDATLRALLGGADTRETALDVALMHGPAAAARLAADGERRADVLEAVRWHTVGSINWEPTGRALYMADFLDPGRQFARRERAALAQRVPREFDGVFRNVVAMRVQWAVSAGKPLAPETVALWNAVR